MIILLTLVLHWHYVDCLFSHNYLQFPRIVSRTSIGMNTDTVVPPYRQPRPQNVPGNLYVDENCIDCDACRWICPTVFGRKGIKAAVIEQPTSTVSIIDLVIHMNRMSTWYQSILKMNTYVYMYICRRQSFKHIVPC